MRGNTPPYGRGEEVLSFYFFEIKFEVADLSLRSSFIDIVTNVLRSFW
ncbi:hypothetical protein CCP3SC5AM1_70020 [Gammaproteobacteria bacterium]